jgi:hypothetical protein
MGLGLELGLWLGVGGVQRGKRVTWTRIGPQADASKPSRAAKGRQRGSWRLVLSLAQSQPPRSEVQRAWEEAMHELAHADVEIAFVEQLPEATTHPTALLGRFCAEIKAGRTALSLVIGGGAAARFLVTAANSMRLPTLWLPFSHRDFIKQVRAPLFTLLPSPLYELPGISPGSEDHPKDITCPITARDISLPSVSVTNPPLPPHTHSSSSTLPLSRTPICKTAEAWRLPGASPTL